MKLSFKNSQGDERVVAEVDSEEQAVKKIYEFCEERDFKIYYVRTWEKNGRKWYDCGSWYEFFVLDKEA